MNKNLLQYIAKNEGYRSVSDLLWDYRLIHKITVLSPTHSKREFIKLLMKYSSKKGITKS